MNKKQLLANSKFKELFPKLSKVEKEFLLKVLDGADPTKTATEINQKMLSEIENIRRKSVLLNIEYTEKLHSIAEQNGTKL